MNKSRLILLAMLLLVVSALVGVRGPNLAIIFLSLVVNMLLAGAGVYPFGGARHCLVLLPMVALLLAAAVQYVFDLISLPEKKKFPAAIIILIFLSLLNFLFLEIIHGGLRGYAGEEFTLTRHDYRLVLTKLRHYIGPRDVILMDDKTFGYFRILNPLPREEEVGDDLRKFLFDEQHPAFVYCAFGFQSPAHIRSAFRAMARHLEPQSDRKIWVLDLGWVNRKVYYTDLALQQALETKLENQGSILVRYNGRRSKIAGHCRALKTRLL